MPTFDPYTYINGMAAALYFIVCLVCGLQFCFDIFNVKEPNNITRLAGCIMLCWSFTALLYILSAIVPSLDWMFIAGITIDILLFAVMAWGAHMLYANRLPKRRKAFLLALPYIIYAIILFFLPDYWCKRLSDAIMATLVLQYLYYIRAIRRHERELDDLYSDKDSHSLRWLSTVVVLYIVWWVLHDIFITDSLIQWFDMVSYTYMACFVLFIYSKICKYSEPVSVYTQKAIEQINDGEATISIDDSKPLQKELVRLMEDKQIYLNPNLTVENVVKELNTNTKYLHAVFHDNMHTTFSQFINGYRVERAKQLLQTTTCKITEIAEQCGFNSASVFHRVFLKMTGKTPTEWRKK